MDNKIWKEQNYRRDKKEMREVLMCFGKRHEHS